MKISETIKNRIQAAAADYRANNNISQYVTEQELQALIEEVENNIHALLQSLVIDTDRDHNTQETAKRVAKMLVLENFRGRYAPKPRITKFPNITTYDQLYTTGPITIRSTCAHHLMPITGKAYVGVFPGADVIGLSKFNRLVDWVASRPTIQEEMTMQIADEIEQQTSAAGVAVLIQAEHGCMTLRGVKEHESDMTTSVLRGVLRTDPVLRQEFFNIISRMK